MIQKGLRYLNILQESSRTLCKQHLYINSTENNKHKRADYNSYLSRVFIEDLFSVISMSRKMLKFIGGVYKTCRSYNNCIKVKSRLLNIGII